MEIVNLVNSHQLPGPELKTYINIANSNGIWRSLPRKIPNVHVIIRNPSILMDLTGKCILSRNYVGFTDLSTFE